MMSFPNRGPEVPEPEQEGAEDVRRSNPASAYDERVTGVIESATTRASAVSRRFGGARYALKRRDEPANGKSGEEPDGARPADGPVGDSAEDPGATPGE
jgi:hypothetical protein